MKPIRITGFILSYLFGAVVFAQLFAEEVSSIVINEVHHNPPDNTVRQEFIELYNPLDEALSLDGWRLSGAVDFNFSKSGSYALPSIDPNQLTMDPTFYNVGINQLIPANSGSNSTLAAGEPQLRHNQVTTGSATIFWNHQTFILGGSPPDEVIGGGGVGVGPINEGGGRGRPIIGGVAGAAFPISGSTLQPNNASNTYVIPAFLSCSSDLPTYATSGEV